MLENASNFIRLGTRGSALATWQAEWVAQQLRQQGTQVELVRIRTEGDIRSESIGQIGGQGVFTKEIQRALLDDRIDLAVHSLKDLPSETVPGLCLAAVPPRASVHDVLVSTQADSIDHLPSAARVGTGSARRRAQLLTVRPDLDVFDLRGNVDSRLRKLREGHCDALILAEAGLRRLNLQEQITQVIPVSLMLPAIGQGALGLETRHDDQRTQQLLQVLDDVPSHQAVQAERSLLAHLQGGCRAPIGAWGRVEDQQLHLEAVVLSADGRQRLVAQAKGPTDAAVELGRQVAETLLDQGAARLLEEARTDFGGASPP